MTNMNGGYTGYSMSNRAVEAYESGEKPLSKWTKADIIECIDNCNVSISLIKKLNIKELRRELLKWSSWHHTSSYCNATDFYEFNYDALKDLTENKIMEIINSRKPKVKPVVEKWECKYLEWSGTRKHPHAIEVVSI